jgi:hypothetical protein
MMIYIIDKNKHKCRGSAEANAALSVKWCYGEGEGDASKG